MNEPEPYAPTFLLENQICFSVYAASRAIQDFYRPLLKEFDLTYPQYLVLITLWTKDEQTVKEIGDALRLDYSTLSPMLKRIESAGYIARQRRVDDERSVIVSLTEEGRALRGRITSVPVKFVCALDMENAADRESFIARMNDITRRMAVPAGGTAT